MDALPTLLDAPQLEKLLLAWMPARRWFRSKSKTPSRISIEGHAQVYPAGNPVHASGNLDPAPVLCIVKVVFTDDSVERYSLPLTLVRETDVRNLPEAAVIGRVGDSVDPSGDHSVLIDASWDAGFRDGLLEVAGGDREALFSEGFLRGSPVLPKDPGVSSNRAVHAGSAGRTSVLLGAEQSNTAFVYKNPSGTGCFLKLYRRLEEAVNPEPETLRFLREHTDYRHVPRLEASLEWLREGNVPVTVGLVQELVEARSDAWEYALHNLRSPDFPIWTALLGRRVAGLHKALSSVPTLPAFAPETITPADLETLRTGILTMIETAFVTLEKLPSASAEDENDELHVLIRDVLVGRARLEAWLRSPPRPEAASGTNEAAPETPAVKFRTHGDLHLGQILVGSRSPEDVWILDFEGEPGRPLAEARRKQSPLRDVAGMLRSFHYAAHCAPSGPPTGALPESPHVLARSLSDAFLRGYRSGQSAESDAPSSSSSGNGLLDLFLVEKVVYELHYELNNRPDWVRVPLRGLLEQISALPLEVPP